VRVNNYVFRKHGDSVMYRVICWEFPQGMAVRDGRIAFRAPLDKRLLEAYPAI
jgi:hypothetical protein